MLKEESHMKQTITFKILCFTLSVCRSWETSSDNGALPHIRISKCKEWLPFVFRRGDTVVCYNSNACNSASESGSKVIYIVKVINLLQLVLFLFIF